MFAVETLRSAVMMAGMWEVRCTVMYIMCLFVYRRVSLLCLLNKSCRILNCGLYIYSGGVGEMPICLNVKGILYLPLLCPYKSHKLGT